MIGLVLIAFGAILTWAVDAHANGLNVTAIGVILLVVGLIVVILDFLWWHTWAAGPWARRSTYVDGGYAARPAAPAPGRRVVVEEEVGGAPPGPPGPPPP